MQNRCIIDYVKICHSALFIIILSILFQRAHPYNCPPELAEDLVVFIFSDVKREYSEICGQMHICLRWEKINNPLILAFYNDKYREIVMDPRKINNPKIFQAVLMHEMGHAYGLNHDINSRVMYPIYLDCEYNDEVHLCEYDINNLKKINKWWRF